jgi:alanine-synthesizing transaminase
MFSSRIQADLTPNQLARTVDGMRAEGRAFLDLTESNPTRAGFDYPADLLSSFADPRGCTYSPQPFGLRGAREAVAGDYERRGIRLDPDRIVLTASTSEAYSLLFKLLCDPDDEVLVPRPSYPLFEHLARLDAVRAVPYQLEYHGTWTIDFDTIDRALSPRTRALLVVTPNNPTGSFVTPAELDEIAARCAPRDVAVIADEVFTDYELTPGASTVSGRVLDRSDVLTFSLGGLSKTIGLPQVKLGWIGVGGSPTTASAVLGRLELAADTYLSVSTPVQLAADELLRRGSSVRRQIQARIAANRGYLVTRASEYPACEVLHAEGGWSAILRVPSVRPEEELVLALLTDAAVLTHPGYFFDFASESYVVVSLLVREEVFCSGASRILRHFDCSVAT